METATNEPALPFTIASRRGVPQALQRKGKPKLPIF
jgi:hypothetical protein